MDHILVVLRTRDERGSGFTALGEMAGALGGELVPYLPTITNYLREAVFHTLSFIAFSMFNMSIFLTIWYFTLSRFDRTVNTWPR